MRHAGRYVAAFVVSATAFGVAGAKAAPARWLLTTGDRSAATASFLDQRDCQDALARLRASADRVWRLRLGEYYERISTNPEPRDDLGRVQLWLAYQRMERARHTRDLTYAGTTCLRR